MFFICIEERLGQGEQGEPCPQPQKDPLVGEQCQHWQLPWRRPGTAAAAPRVIKNK